MMRINFKLLRAAVVTITGVFLIATLQGDEQGPAKRRRIIVNDDSQPVFDQKTPETFLSDRFQQTTGTQVDTYIIYVGDGWHPHRGRKPDPGLGDPYQVIVDAAHREGTEIFASLRMNDVHCSWDGTLSPLQRKRPDLRLGEDVGSQQYPHLLEGEQGLPPDGYPLSLMQAFWTALNYAKPEVRELRRARVEEVAKAYDFDGFELDFCRAEMFFKPGEERENLAVMTDFVRQVRRTLNEIGTQRGRPYLFVVKVPDTPDMALRAGLDVKTWLDEHLVDMLMVAGGYMPFSDRVKEFIDIAHRHGIPAYPSVDLAAWYSDAEKIHKQAPPHALPFDSYGEPDKVRSIASNFWALGGDGVYLFNWSHLPHTATEQLALLNQIGDVATLQNTPKRFQPDNGLDNWVTYAGFTRAPRQFPVRLVDGTPIELMVGDNVQQAAKDGRLGSLVLRIEVSKLHKSEGIDLSINGTPVPASAIERAHVGEFQVNLSESSLKQGLNKIVVLPGKGSIGRIASEVAWVELLVKYQ